MKPLFYFSAFLAWTVSMYGEEMEQTKEEAVDFAKSQREVLRSSMAQADPQTGASNFSCDDFLPESDKGKTFDPGNASNELEVKAFISSASKRERLEGTEEFFSNSRSVDPQLQIGMVSEETVSQSTGERFETCQEAGTYQIFLTQQRVVEIVPAVTKQVRYCKGHEEHEKCHLEKKAKDYLKKKEKELTNDMSIGSFKVKITDGGIFHRYVVVSAWTHKDGVECKRSRVEEKIVQEASETDRWETDDPEALSYLSSDPDCRMLYSQILAGAETRPVNGSLVFRDSWVRNLFFSCGDSQNSKCAKLRESGAQLHKKKCLKEIPFRGSECGLWEKVYRISAGTEQMESKAVFAGEGIWGISGSFDSSYEANADFGTSVTTLAIFSDIKRDIEESNIDFAKGKGEVFKGKVLECQRSFIEGALYDCCSKMDGVAVTSKLCRCTSEEKDLATKREEGKCHYIGTYKKNLGTEKVQAFCCFPTKLARVIHEEGRAQLGIPWGHAEKPDCSGFSIDQLKSIDFSIVDLSEVVEDLKVDKAFIQRKMQDVSRDLRSEENKLRMKQQSEEKAQWEKQKGGAHG